MNAQNLSRIMGIIWIITSFLWVFLALAGLFYGLSFLERLQGNLENNIDLVIDSIDPVHRLVDESTEVISSTYQSLHTVQNTMNDASIALTDLRPLLWKTRTVVTEDIPSALDGVQDSMPSLIATAKSIDETLVWLSGFGFTIPNPLGADWSFDLGISYAPDVPLDQALETMSGNLEGLPDNLRDMEENLNATDDNLATVSEDLAQLAVDLKTTNQEIAAFNPKMGDLAIEIENIQRVLDETRSNIPKTIHTARRILLIVLGLLIFTQIPSFYMGWQLTRETFSPSNFTGENQK